jgi:Uma2 family endonuclease
VRHRTAAEWLHDLGDVPLERIIFDPLPGTATEADVLRLEAQEGKLCELIDGTLVEKAMGYEESAIALRIAFLLQSFILPRKLGVVSGEAGMMRILRPRVRMPDVAYVSRERLPGGRVPKEPIPDLVPDLAVEVLSESNTPREISLKLREYLDAGVRLVWIVDPRLRTVEVHRPSAAPVSLTESETIDAGDVLPGFSVAVSEFFNID